MTATRDDARPLGLLGAFLLGAGLAGRLLVAESTGPVASVAPCLILLCGAAVILFERALRGGAGFHPALIVLPLLVVPGFFPLEARGVARGCDLVAAAAAGLGLRDLVLREGLRPALLRALLALAFMLGLLALAQTLYQREQVEALHHRLVGAMQEAGGVAGAEGLASEQARAFVSSRRSAATFVNANVFGGFLLLVLPLFLAGLASARSRALILLPLAVALGAFACAGSAGALLALLLGSGSLLLLRGGSPRLRRAATGAFVAGVLGVVLLGLSLATGWEPPLVGAKVATFAERLDYHRLAFGVLPDMGPFGIGLENFGPLARNLQVPGESWSFFVHDSWLQLLLECGPLALLALLPLLLALRGLCRCVDGGEPREGTPLIGRLFLAGVLAGAAAAPLVSPGLTLMPLDSALADNPALTMLTTCLPVALALFLLRDLAWEARTLRAALLLALAAFLLHGLLDFDVYVAGAATAFGALLAALPGRLRAPAGPGRAALGLSAALLLLLPLLAGRTALTRDRVLFARLPGSGADPELFVQAASATPIDLDALEPALVRLSSTLRAAQAERLLEGLPALLRRRSDARLAEARYLHQRAVLARVFAQEAITRLERLRRPGDILDPEVLYLRFDLLRRLEDPRARAAAEETLAAAGCWHLAPAEVPFLGRVSAFLGR